MSKWSVLVELIGKSDRLMRELSTSEKGVRRFGAAARSEFAALKTGAVSLQGKLAGIGLSLGGVAFLRQSAAMDKRLTQIGQTAGTGTAMVAGLRSELYGMGKQAGRDIDGLADGFNNLIQAGQSWKASLESIKAINIASAVTGASENILSGGLTVGATAFDIDLEKPGKALEMLDKMTAAGRLGNAELENLSAIFARVGVNAASAGMGFDKTLAFLETLSLVERNPERLGTLADSTLRLFTNMRYMRSAEKATRVKFYDAKGERRDAREVLRDIKKEYDKLSTDRQRDRFINRAFGEMDLDTIKGLRTLFSGSSLSKWGEFEDSISKALGDLNRDLPGATADLGTQANRLKITLKEAADGFAKPIKDALAEWIKWTLDSKENGGLGASGKQLILGGAGLAAGTAVAARYGAKLTDAALKRLLPGAGSVAASVVAGQALEEVAGVQSVFVVNWPENMGGMLPGVDKSKLLTGAALLRYGTAGGAVAGLNWALDSGADIGFGGKIRMGLGSLVEDWKAFSEYYAAMLDIISGARDREAGEKQPITINMPVTIDPASGRVTAESDHMGAVVRPSLERGGF